MKHFARTLFTIGVVAAFAATCATSAAAESADPAEIEELRAEVHQLEEQLKLVKQRLDAREAAASNASAATPPAVTSASAVSPAAPSAKVTINDKGVAIASADGANSIKFRGLVQLDSRLFFHESGLTNNAFVLRRARLITEGTFSRDYAYQLVTEFGGSSVSILDANVTLAVSSQVQFKFGKFKVPIGLERLQSDSWTFFNERSIATNLTPDRDLGVQVSGDVFQGVVNYAAGVFGGVPDAGSTTNSDFDNEKDFAARVLVSPFKNVSDSAFRGLSFGVGASTGRQKSSAGRTAGYKTDGQQTFFAYNSAVVADGRVWRVAPQVDYRRGPLGVMGEYIVSAVNLRPAAGAPKSELRNHAWQIATGYVLTGDASSYNGVVPAKNFDWAAGTWGAVEVVVRRAAVRIDRDAFPVFAAPASAAADATSTGVGINWYLSKVVRLTFDYYLTDFGPSSPVMPASAAPLLRLGEQAFISRFQLSF